MEREKRIAPSEICQTTMYHLATVTNTLFCVGGVRLLVKYSKDNAS